MESRPLIFTIGYGGRSPAEFIDMLRKSRVRLVVDVRLRPDRASMGIWVKARTADSRTLLFAVC